MHPADFGTVATVSAAFRFAGPIEGSVVGFIGRGVLGLNACAMALTLVSLEQIEQAFSASSVTIGMRTAILP